MLGVSWSVFTVLNVLALTLNSEVESGGTTGRVLGAWSLSSPASGFPAARSPPAPQYSPLPILGRFQVPPSVCTCPVRVPVPKGAWP